MKNSDWLSYLASDLKPSSEGASQPQAANPWILSSGLIHLKEVQALVARKRGPMSVELLATTRESIPIPAVLMPSSAIEEPTYGRGAWLAGTFGLALGAFILGGLLLGGQGVSPHSQDPGGLAAVLTSSPAGDEAAQGEAQRSDPLEAPVLGLAVAPVADVEHRDVMVVEPLELALEELVAEGVAEGGVKVAFGSDVKRLTRDRRPNGAHRPGRGAVETNHRASAPAAGSGRSLHEALAAASGQERQAASAAPAGLPALDGPSVALRPTAAEGSSVAVAAGAMSLPAATPGEVEKSPRRSENGIGALLERAGGQALGGSSAASATTPPLPEQLGADAVTRLSGHLASRVRHCAGQFGFARLTIHTRVQVAGQTGQVSQVTLPERFAGSPMEHCVRRGASALRAGPFRSPSQTISVPVVVR